MKIAITTETTCDLSPEQIAKNDIKVLPLTVILGEKSGLDGIDITPQDIFDYAENHKDLPRTSAVNEFTYEDFFKGVQKDYDAIIHIALSSGLSSSCENAIKELEDALNGTDLELIKQKKDALLQAAQGVATKAYQKAQASSNQDTTTGPSQNDDGTVNADYEDVSDNK